MPAYRDTALDALKWLALACMVLDHLRYLGFAPDMLYIPGRLAFPGFCLAIAAHQARRERSAPLPWRNVGWMLLFAVVSELPYRLYVVPADTLNVMPTLALGLLVTNACRQRTPLARVLGAMALAIAIACNDQLMFGLAGVLLPATLWWAWSRPAYWQIVPGIVCLWANVWLELFTQARQGYWVAMAGILACLVAPALGMALLHRGQALRPPPLGRWAYGFYPVHFLALWALRALVQ